MPSSAWRVCTWSLGSCSRYGGTRRLLATGVFGGDTTRAALTEASRLGMDVRVLNLGGGTYHPKIYFFDGSPRRGIIGSGNLTAGLVCNVEAGLLLEAGPALDGAWLLGEELWEHADATPWRPEALVPPVESMSEQLFGELLASLREGQIIPTLQGQRSNKIVTINMDAVWVETEATSANALLDTWEPNQIALLTTKHRHPVHAEKVMHDGDDAYWEDFFAADDVFYGTVSGFKGLERTCVILAVNGFSAEARAKETLYVGLSRAQPARRRRGPGRDRSGRGAGGVRRRLLDAEARQPPLLD